MGSRTTKADKAVDKKSELAMKAREARPRDDLKKAFAGNENKGPAGNQKKDHLSSTSVKSRHMTKKSEGTATEE